MKPRRPAVSGAYRPDEPKPLPVQSAPGAAAEAPPADATVAELPSPLSFRDLQQVINREREATLVQIVNAIVFGNRGNQMGDALRAHLQALTVERLDLVAEKLDELIAEMRRAKE